MPGVLYPFEAVADALRCSPSQAARQLGIDSRRLAKYTEFGVPLEAAEAIAHRAGFHPYNLWPDMLDETTRACTVCGRRFVPYPCHPNTKTCSKPCRRVAGARVKAAWLDRRRAQPPAFEVGENADPRHQLLCTCEAGCANVAVVKLTVDGRWQGDAACPDHAPGSHDAAPLAPTVWLRPASAELVCTTCGAPATVKRHSLTGKWDGTASCDAHRAAA